MEINNRKIIGKLYQELKEISNEDFYVEEGRLCTEIVNYLDDLSGKLPYSISFSTELEVSSLFKLYDLKLDVETESLLQKLIEYLQIMSSLCSIKLIVLVNIKHYLNNTQILELYKTAFYCKISLFLIEAAQKDILKLKAAHLDGKVKGLIEIIRQNPWQIPPSYEKLVGDLQGSYSRRINLQHRLIYQVYEEERIIKIISLWSHYER